jgi:hypothetical protein
MDKGPIGFGAAAVCYEYHNIGTIFLQNYEIKMK